MSELKKQTTLVVNWRKTRHSSAMQMKRTGSGLPKEIKRMVAQQLLDELKIRIQIH